MPEGDESKDFSTVAYSGLTGESGPVILAGLSRFEATADEFRVGGSGGGGETQGGGLDEQKLADLVAGQTIESVGFANSISW